MIARLMSTGARPGPRGGSVAWYCEINPHRGMRAPRLICRSTVSSIGPATLSK